MDYTIAYTIVDNKIQTPEGCQLNVVHHCNLACRSCSHLSPVAHKFLVDADSVFCDFSTLAKYYSPPFIKILGGEPLLHPRLPDIIDAIRSSGICNHIHVCTNGTLLPRMPSQFWEKVDSIEVSVYPGNELNDENLKLLRHTAKTYNVNVELFYYGHFRESYSEVGTKNDHLVRRIYKTCQIAHVWRCHTVFNGHFFRCPQSVFMPRVMSSDPEEVYKDGLEIVDSPDFGTRLLAYLESTHPLTACYHCLGSAGKLFDHEQQARRGWRARQQYSTEALLDEERLTALEWDPLADDGCIRRGEILFLAKKS